jgi:alkylation response protein AidB-like acyl-CoA dehydrogenase
MGPSSDDFFASLERPIADPAMRQRAAQVFTEKTILELLGHRIATEALDGGDPGPFASIRKTLSDVHGQHITSLHKDLRGAAAMLGEQNDQIESTDEWHWAYLFSLALTIGGGTSEVQRNIIGEQLLGLPR